MKISAKIVIASLAMAILMLAASAPVSAESAASKMGKGATQQQKQAGSRTSASSEHGSVRGTINGGGDFVNRCKIVKGKRYCS